jgi:hypothetical protein
MSLVPPELLSAELGTLGFGVVAGVAFDIQLGPPGAFGLLAPLFIMHYSG